MMRLEKDMEKRTSSTPAASSSTVPAFMIEAKEEAFLKLAQSVEQLERDMQKALSRISAIDLQAQQSIVASSELEILRQGLTKVVEVFRLEHARFREDCCDALQSARRGTTGSQA